MNSQKLYEKIADTASNKKITDCSYSKLSHISPNDLAQKAPSTPLSFGRPHVKLRLSIPRYTLNDLENMQANAMREIENKAPQNSINNSGCASCVLTQHKVPNRLLRTHQINQRD